MLPEERLRLALLFWVILTVVVGEFIVLVVWLAERLGKDVSKSQFAQRKVRVAFTALSLVLMLCFLYGYFIEPHWIEVTHFTLPTPKLTRGTNLTLVHLSDLHSEGWGHNEQALPSIVNRYKPDFIFLTGDYLNNRKSIAAVRKLVRRLRAKQGIYAVMGNWDVWYFPDVSVFDKLPVQVLDGNGVRLKGKGGWIYIAGVSVSNEHALGRSLLGQQKGDLTVFLYHYPDLIDEVRRHHVDLYLAGHTHGGQIALPFYGALVTLSRYGKRYERGLYRVGRTILYVNRGIGIEGGFPPIRFCARPEVTVIHLVGSRRLKPAATVRPR